MKTLFKFLLIILAMAILTIVPYGMYINSLITVIALWTLAKEM